MVEVIARATSHSVAVLPGLRLHTTPKVASTSIHKAVRHIEYPSALPEDDGPEFRFMVVRHPLDRLVSIWSFFLRDNVWRGQGGLTALGYRVGMPFSEFVAMCCDLHPLNHHTRRQIEFAGPLDRFDGERGLLATIGRLTSEWDALRARFPYLNPLGMENKSNHGAWTEYFGDALFAHAMEVFAEDATLFERAVAMTTQGSGLAMQHKQNASDMRSETN